MFGCDFENLQGTKYEFRSQVPVVDGCTNLQYCLYEESSLCLCKPKCDMAGLNPPGKCNDMGQCCQTICQGYSTADLFPDDNQPRCGSVIDPIGMPWCNGALDQQFIFTSEKGQIDLTVLRNPSQVPIICAKSEPQSPKYSHEISHARHLCVFSCPSAIQKVKKKIRLQRINQRLLIDFSRSGFVSTH